MVTCPLCFCLVMNATIMYLRDSRNKLCKTFFLIEEIIYELNMFK